MNNLTMMKEALNMEAEVEILDHEESIDYVCYHPFLDLISTPGSQRLDLLSEAVGIPGSLFHLP